MGILVRLCVRLFTALIGLLVWNASYALDLAVPERTAEVVNALKQGSWQRQDEGIDVLRTITRDGMVITTYRISPEQFSIDVVLQDIETGSYAKDIGEREGAILAVNGGFFAQTEAGKLYSVGYLRLAGTVFSKGWPSAGGLVEIDDGDLGLRATHAGIPKNGKDVLQTKPMIMESGGKWSMGSDLGKLKNRTLLCKLKNGDVIFVLITRVGMSLYEAGWVLRAKDEGGFFGCDAAVALDGGSSTQVWYSGRPALSYSSIAPVQNFIVVRFRDN
ncbi:MAG: phosphodiester glycosidase family protein [Pseudomonadota bacterium]